MGIPQNYSTELPDRCLALIEHLLPFANAVKNEIAPYTSTFLLSMSMPIITIPLERLDRNGRDPASLYVDDGLVSPYAQAAFEGMMGREAKNTPFFEKGAWSLYKCPRPDGFNISRRLPEDVAFNLSTDDAISNATELRVSQWLRCLRNALAHGGICYLNTRGQVSYDTAVKMFAFVSKENTNRQDRLEPYEIRFLRVEEEAYLRFLRKWVSWLIEIGALVNDPAR